MSELGYDHLHIKNFADGTRRCDMCEKRGAAAARKRVVAWLRRQGCICTIFDKNHAYPCPDHLADRLEREEE